jgi:hypothetical protein
VGEKAIYKRRGEQEPELGAIQEKPKKMYFLFDVSARYGLHFFFLDFFA